MDLYVVVRDDTGAIIDGGTYTSRADARYQSMLLNQADSGRRFSARQLGEPIPAQPCPACHGRADATADCLTCDGIGLAVERAQ